MSNKIKRTVLMLCLVLAFALAGCAKGDDSDQAETTVQEIAAESNLVIPVNELSGTVKFYPVTVDGIDMATYCHFIKIKAAIRGTNNIN